MIYEVIDCEQGSEEWLMARLGLWTSSNFSNALTPKFKESVSIKKEEYKLASEIICQEIEDTFKSSAMERGNELESEALSYFNFLKELDMKTCGFIKNKKGYGCSPDAINFNIKAGLEIKCPLPKKHIEYVEANILPPEYVLQVQGHMMVTGFEYWYFMSYHPLIKPLILLVKRDEELISKLHDVLTKSNKTIEEIVERQRL